ncbi:MAG: DUF3828 domain-containing protein [Pseudomonadota bacterium]|nr:DUF3828 domain-containing protein [Pseudomonadota bacterium]
MLALCAFAAGTAAGSTCVGDSPVAVARWVSNNRPQLAAPDSSRFITTELLASIRRDAAQAAANDEICGICGGDLWTNSQEGYARAPISFRQSMRSGGRAEVIYSLCFSIAATGPSEPRSARVELRKEQGCWKIDDIVHGDNSIKRLVTATK